MRFATRPVGSTPSPTVYLRFASSFSERCRCANRVASAVVAVASAPTPTDSLSLSLARSHIRRPFRSLVQRQVGIIGAENGRNISKLYYVVVENRWNLVEWM